MNKTIKISNDDYVKEGKSYQDKLTPDEVKDKLAEYSRVENIDEIPINSHIRYFSIDPKTNKKSFRLGGFLTKIDKDYIVLSNGKISWSVQKNSSIFFKKLSYQELKDELIEKISHKYEKQITMLAEENEKLKKTLKMIKNTVKK
jgi:hypothetical protein